MIKKNVAMFHEGFRKPLKETIGVCKTSTGRRKGNFEQRKGRGKGLGNKSFGAAWKSKQFTSPGQRVVTPTLGKSGRVQTLEEFVSDLMGGELEFYACQRDYI